MPTPAQAQDAVYDGVKTVWDGSAFSAVPLLWLGFRQDPPQDGTAWVRGQMQHVTGGDDAIGGQFFKQEGVFIFEVYASDEDGGEEALDMSNVLLSALEGQKYGGVWLRRARIRSMGIQGPWYRTNVTVDFEYTYTR